MADANKTGTASENMLQILGKVFQTPVRPDFPAATLPERMHTDVAQHISLQT
jgi:hypothetical protein